MRMKNKLYKKKINYTLRNFDHTLCNFDHTAKLKLQRICDRISNVFVTLS